jgi:hypothetical protein
MSGWMPYRFEPAPPGDPADSRERSRTTSIPVTPAIAHAWDLTLKGSSPVE